MDEVGPELLSELLDEHSAALVLFAQQWCTTPEDVVQEAFVRLMRQRPTPGEPARWLYRVVRNGAISASRASARRTRHETAAACERGEWFAPAAGEQLDAQTATAALESLPIALRETVVLRLWSGLPFEQIAELTETSASTAHRRYADGLAALRKQLRLPTPQPGSLDR